MAKKGPGKHYRKGMSLTALFRKFPNDEVAEEWFVQRRWKGHVKCPKCGSDNIQDGTTHPDMRFRCRSCRKFFSTRTGTVMQASNLGFQVWAIAIFQMTTNLKGVSSMKLHRDLDIAQKNAWHLAHRIRETFDDQNLPFGGPVEVDETYVGGKRKNMSNAKRKALKNTGRGAVGKATVVGAKDRESKQVKAQVIPSASKTYLHEFLGEITEYTTPVYSDEWKGYQGIPNPHETVCHSVSEYVKDQAHTNGIESFWALLKRGYHGTFHHMSPQHLHRYVNEFAGRHNIRNADTIKQMQSIVAGMVGKRLMYRELAGNAA